MSQRAERRSPPTALKCLPGREVCSLFSWRWHGLLLGVVLVGAALRADPPSGVAGEGREDIPRWWRETRAFYCPFTNSGAGSSLMKYNAGGHLTDRLDHFHELPVVLDDARRLGTDVVYLVDYWQPDYEAKGEYIPYAKLGGKEGFREGIERLHDRGGRILLYLEAFIISRKTEFGRRVGPDWAMMDRDGNYYPYYQTGDRFYLMYPGEGSGWSDHLVSLAETMAKEYRIDGVHLDSYGLQWGWRDFHPGHPGGNNPESFNRGAVQLVKRIRAALREHRPDAVVILEGAERRALLDICDGAQIESLSVLKRKPWWEERRYPIFTSSFELLEMQAILEAGYQLALSPWWLGADVRGRHEKRLSANTDKRNRFDQLEALNVYNNWLVANDIPGALPLGMTEKIGASIIEQLNARGWQGEFVNPALEEAAARVRRLYSEHEERFQRTPAERIRELLESTGWRARSRSSRRL